MKKVLLSLIAVTMLFNLFIVCVNADTKTNDGVYELTEEGHNFFQSIFEYDRIMPLMTNKELYSSYYIPKSYKWEEIKWDEKTFITAMQNLYSNEILPAVENGLCATVLTQLSDVEDETNGILTYDRRVQKLKESDLKPIFEEIFNKFNNFYNK